ncbi:MAG TPA: hypothetical protein VFZ66_20545 [Herpetosiphonaceae bacterium]
MQRSHFWSGCAAATLLMLSGMLAACGAQPTSPTGPPSQPPVTQTDTAVETATTPPDGECAAVERIAPDSEEGTRIGAALLAALPATQSPELQRAAPYAFDEVWDMSKVGTWVVVQASFKEALEPGIFVLQATDNGYRYEGLAWAGMADSAAAVRDGVAGTLPDAARALAACIDVSRWSVS